ncbi:PREDICTED: putative uncharacterized protein C5orf58 homolog isoform X2 [Rhinopithecus bieti]|uniref:putative uncharacterized protein C5orf58 homolog isoform X2 n=1 Tax=Rhinopithecus bieti TaxID=61621 RepID=UPI00083BC865|nr:PREDICTED: putative uncharacterized protein C5orf58 homolog isoform X2 [Rhinopithecus bieti]
MPQAEKLANQGAPLRLACRLAAPVRISVTVGRFFYSGSEMREIGEILPAQEKVEARTDLKMGKKSANDHKLNVDKVIKNINTISLELKKIKAATAKGTGIAKTSLDQSELTAGAGERNTSKEIKL